MESRANYSRPAGFTIVELMVSMAILAILLVVMGSIMNQTTKAWTSTRGKIEQFRQAREGFDSMTRRLSQSTLNTYLDYEDASSKTRTTNNASTFVPVRYARQSDLRFISGPGLAGSATDPLPRPTHAIFFQAPLGVVDKSAYSGLQNLLNTWGYYIEYSDDHLLRPAFVTTPLKNRFRLIELIQPSESMSLYDDISKSGGTYNGTTWFSGALTGTDAPVHVLAENVIALVLIPKLTPEEDSTGIKLSPNYSYDTTKSKAEAELNPKNQLPPVVQVTMVAIDEISAGRLSDADNVELKDKLNILFKDAARYTDDLAALEDYLVNKKINFRTFTTNVSIKGAKWSREQKN